MTGSTCDKGRVVLPANGREKKREIIRQVEIDDLSAIYHLGEKLFTSDELPILYRTWHAHKVTEFFTSDSEYCLVAEVDNQIAGFVIASTIWLCL